MKKRNIFKIVAAVLFFAIALIWLISVAAPEKFTNFDAMWLLTALGIGLGITCIVKGFVIKTTSAAMKFDIFIGAVFIVAGVLALVGSVIDTKLVLPIIAVVLTAAALISLFVVGGKKWDAADNEKEGYKSYRDRKNDEESEK